MTRLVPPRNSRCRTRLIRVKYFLSSSERILVLLDRSRRSRVQIILQMTNIERNSPVCCAKNRGVFTEMDAQVFNLPYDEAEHYDLSMAPKPKSR